MFNKPLNDVPRWGRAARFILRHPHTERDAAIYREARWDEDKTKAAVGAFTSDNYNNETSVQAAFAEFLTRQAVLGRMADRCQRTGFNTPTNSAASPVARFVREREVVSLHRENLENHTLPAEKIAVITAHTEEALDQEGAEEAIVAAMANATREAADERFLDPNASDADGPASITRNAEEVAATSDPAQSFRALLRNFRNLDSSYLILHPETAAELSLTTLNGANVFPDVGVLGGTICGLPVLCSQSAPFDSSGATITLVDASRILLAMGGVQIKRSNATSLEFDDEIDSNGDAERISLWQSNTIAAMTTLSINWKVMDSGAVRILTGASW